MSARSTFHWKYSSVLIFFFYALAVAMIGIGVAVEPFEQLFWNAKKPKLTKKQKKHNEKVSTSTGSPQPCPGTITELARARVVRFAAVRAMLHSIVGIRPWQPTPAWNSRSISARQARGDEDTPCQSFLNGVHQIGRYSRLSDVPESTG